jgi:hypothetical protein
MYNPRHVTKGRIIQQKVPVDFDTEITDADFALDPSLIDSQAGQYFVKNIGLFGEADPTEKVGSVIAQQTADEHPASANVPVPPSHQKEGRPKVLRKIMKGGMMGKGAQISQIERYSENAPVDFDEDDDFEDAIEIPPFDPLDEADVDEMPRTIPVRRNEGLLVTEEEYDEFMRDVMSQLQSRRAEIIEEIETLKRDLHELAIPVLDRMGLGDVAQAEAGLFLFGVDPITTEEEAEYAQKRNEFNRLIFGLETEREQIDKRLDEFATA